MYTVHAEHACRTCMQNMHASMQNMHASMQNMHASMQNTCMYALHA